jgi:hypothetical protein
MKEFYAFSKELLMLKRGDQELESSDYPQVPDYIYDRIEEEREKY